MTREQAIDAAVRCAVPAMLGFSRTIEMSEANQALLCAMAEGRFPVQEFAEVVRARFRQIWLMS